MTNGAAHNERSHCEHSPSSAYRWMACPGSIQLCRRMPPAPTSSYAEEGTSAHELGEYCLRHRDIVNEWVGKEWNGQKLSADFVDAVYTYVDYVRKLIQDADWYAIERQFFLDPLDPPAPMHGTADFLSLTKGRLDVVDYKHGQGVPVEVEGNKQLRYYALGALLSLHQAQADKVQTVRITVVQPRAPHPDGPIRSEEISVIELLDFALDLFDGVQATLAEAPKLVPGDHCRFCPAHAQCPALRDAALEVAKTEFAAEDSLAVSPPPEALTTEELARLMSRFHLVEQWMASVREHAYNVLLAGGEMPGWKLVPKRATRKWRDEKALGAWARKEKIPVAQIFEPQTLRSPAALEKEIGKNRIPEELIEKTSSGLTLAEASDPRPAVLQLSAADEFSALTPQELQ